jgi:hypothetical protein
MVLVTTTEPLVPVENPSAVKNDLTSLLLDLDIVVFTFPSHKDLCCVKKEEPYSLQIPVLWIRTDLLCFLTGL